MKNSYFIVAILLFMCSCKQKRAFTISDMYGIWKIDSSIVYRNGISTKNATNLYWEFNEHNNLISFNKDPINSIVYFSVDTSKIVEPVINISDFKNFITTQDYLGTKPFYPSYKLKKIDDDRLLLRMKQKMISKSTIINWHLQICQKSFQNKSVKYVKM